jgi:hypothetical protein
MPNPPQLTDEQRKAALAKAAEARRVRAEKKELLKTGSLSLSELLAEADSDAIVAGLKVEKVIAAMPGTGKIKAKRMMESLGIAENRRLRGLGANQRAALLNEFS